MEVGEVDESVKVLLWESIVVDVDTVDSSNVDLTGVVDVNVDDNGDDEEDGIVSTDVETAVEDESEIWLEYSNS